MSANQRRGPPLAGRPPFATDEDDGVYDNAPAQPRQRQLKPAQQGAGRDSMYQAWDNYLHTDKDQQDSRPNSGAGGIGMGLMAGDLDDSDDDDLPRGGNTAPLKSANAPLKSSNLRPAESQPRPSNDSQRNNGLSRPAPAAMAGAPGGRQGSYDRPQQHQQQHQQQQMQQNPIPRGTGTTGVQRPAAAALRVDVPQPAMPIPRAPIPAFMPGPSPSPSPSFIPHPLNAPSTPITPVFARPSFQAEPPKEKVKFKDGTIMRGNSEETLIPRGTAKGEEFWRRFSFVAKEEPKRKKSRWLRNTTRTNTTCSRFVWCISIVLLLAIGGAIGIGWYLTHNDKAAPPLAVGGSANQSQLTSVGAANTAAAAASNTSRVLVAPTAVETKKRDLEDVGPTPAPASPTATPAAFARRAHGLAARNRLNRLD